VAKPAHTRCTFEGITGAVAAPLEHWSLNINFPADAEPADSAGPVADGVAAACKQAWVDTMGDHVTSDTHLTRVKVAHVNADGHVDVGPDGAYSQGVWEGDEWGALTPRAMPLQTALCVSLVTARAGATGKGRFFLPWPGMDIDAVTKRLTDAQVTTIATDARDLLNALAVIMTFAPQVVSSKGYMSEVIAVKVGRAPDTMRSRRSDLPEGYHSLPL
jgi:hypothetical protein